MTPRSLAAQNGNPRQWLSEASGLVTLTPTSGPTLRVPVYAAARPASSTKVDGNLKVKDGVGTLTIKGKGVNTGAEPLGYLSKVSAFELGATSGKATLGTGVSEYARAADLEYIGAARKGSTMYFGLSTHGNWATPATEVGFNIQIDRDNNGTVDVTAFTTRFTIGPNADPLDVFVVGVGTAAVGFTNVFNSNVNTAPYNSNVLTAPVPLASLGLPAGATSFRYRVQGISRFWGTIDTTPWATYNVATPGLTFPDGLAATHDVPGSQGREARDRLQRRLVHGQRLAGRAPAAPLRREREAGGGRDGPGPVARTVTQLNSGGRRKPASAVSVEKVGVKRPAQGIVEVPEPR